jgi:outer membrane protein assembly factor BamA
MIHFMKKTGRGLLAGVLVLGSAALIWSDETTADSGDNHSSASVFPIAMYDSDIGFGLGGKAVMKSYYGKKESFDITIFGSSKGEQWYAFAFSIPDNEIRQRTTYPMGIDLSIEFDKLLKSNFFGIGNDSPDNQRQFPREFFRIKALASHPFSTEFTGTLGVRMAHYSVYDYEPAWLTITDQTPGAGETNLSAIVASFRYDTRDSWINPHRGIKIEVGGEQALKVASRDWDFSKTRLEFCFYQKLITEKHVMALRWWMQDIRGDAPYQELSKVGDGWTARGFKADRFLDRSMALTSLEYRFPIFRKLGGVAFVDAGRVWPEFGEFGFSGWHSDWGAGLRYYLANFVTRLDAGTSQEGTRIFINFGQVF